MEVKDGVIPEGKEGEKTIDLTQLDADKVLTAFGKYGKYQMLAYSITTITWIMFAAEMMVMAFITAEPSFSCEVNDQSHTLFPLSHSNDSCKVYDIYNVSYACGINGTKFVFNSSIGETLVSEFNLVCADGGMAQSGTSIFLIGSMLATPFLSQMSDKYGRRWVFMLPVWLTAVANIFCALSPNYIMFLIFRFLAGVGSAGLSAIGWVLCCESVSLKFRSMFPLLGTITWVTGYLLVGVFAHYITNWRWLYFVLSVPGILTIVFYWLLPESLHWMITQKDTEGIKHYIEKSTKFNNRKIVLEECMTLTKEGGDGEAVSRSILDILRSKKLIFHLVLFSYIAIANDLYYWTLSLFSVDLSEDRFTGYILSGLVEVPSGLIAIPLLQWFSRKSLSFASLFSQGVFLLCLVFVENSPWLALILPLLGKAANSVAWSSVVLILPEMIPTTIRNVFYGIVVFLSNIGSIAAPYIGNLKKVDVRLPPLILGSMSVVAAFCVFFFPETKGIALPEDLADLNAGPFLNFIARRKGKTENDKVKEKKNSQILDNETIAA
uniref:Major facilitator superfamily (MFS) profile domain-containing protein n=1 Tax=Plectus sambesii TaxID=2011161 RepID=A0A914XEY2_9BILA